MQIGPDLTLVLVLLYFFAITAPLGFVISIFLGGKALRSYFWSLLMFNILMAFLIINSTPNKFEDFTSGIFIFSFILPSPINIGIAIGILAARWPLSVYKLRTDHTRGWMWQDNVLCGVTGGLIGLIVLIRMILHP